MPASAATPAASSQVAIAVGGTTQSATFATVAGGYSGALSLPAASSGSGATVTSTLSATAPSGAPTLQSTARLTQAIGGSPGALAYITFVASGSIAFASTPTFTVTVPSTISIPSGSSVYAALFDPTAPTLGWVAFEGPATVSGQTYTFTPVVRSTSFSANVSYIFSIFTLAQATASPTPTVSGSASPAATATATASAVASASPTAAATSSPSVTPTATATATSSPTSSPSPTPTASPTASPTPFVFPQIVSQSPTSRAQSPISLSRTAATTFSITTNTASLFTGLYFYTSSSGVDCVQFTTVSTGAVTVKTFTGQGLVSAAAGCTETVMMYSSPGNSPQATFYIIVL